MTDAPEPPAVLAEGARCAIHPALPAESTCSRCGNYMCRSCAGPSQLGLCLACRQRAGTDAFPFDRDHYSLDGLFSHALARFKQHWVPLVLTTVVFFVLLYGVFIIGFLLGVSSPLGRATPRSLSPTPLVFQGVQALFQIALQLPLLGLSVDVAAGKEPVISAALERLRRLPAALLQLLVIYVSLGLALGMLGALGYIVLKLSGTLDHPPWLLLVAAGVVLTIPLIYFGLGVMFGTLELVYNPEASAIGALRTSFALADGQRWPILGISFVCGIIAVAGVIGCCVGIVGSMPLSTLLYCSLFLALRNRRL